MFCGHQLLCRRGGRVVFRGLDFAVAPGGALILRGANGAGKSSLLRIMAGLISPLDGRLSWDGRTIDSEEHRARLRYIGHLDGLKPALTPKEDLDFWARFEGGAPHAAGQALDQFGLAGVAENPIRFLSAGQRRRVALARLLLSERALWLLDEPTLALDDSALAILSAVIAAHRARHGILIVATHGAMALPGASTIELGLRRGARDDGARR
jgi:heme exporter protein A